MFQDYNFICYYECKVDKLIKLVYVINQEMLQISHTLSQKQGHYMSKYQAT